MTKRYISPQSGPVDIKTDKDSHTPRTGHTKPAGRQNKALYAFAIRHPDQIPVNLYESEAVDES